MPKYHVRVERSQTEVGYCIVEASNEDAACDAVKDALVDGDAPINWVEWDTHELSITANDAQPEDRIDLEANEESKDA